MIGTFATGWAASPPSRVRPLSKRSPCPSRVAGFTVLELLVAVGLTVMLAVAVMPRMSAYDDLKLRAVADALRRDLSGLRMMAERTGSRQRVETAADHYRLGPSANPLSGRTVDIPPGLVLTGDVSLEFDSLGRPRVLDSGQAQSLLRAAEIRISSSDASVTVRVEPLTGLARVVQ